MLKKIFNNRITSLLGGIAGVPQIVEGFTTGNYWKIFEGASLLLLGLCAKDANK